MARIARKYNSKGSEVWRHQLEYSYSVNGKPFCGHRIRFGIPSALLWFAPTDPSFHQFRQGADVVVYHSPSRPSTSSLQQGVSAFAFVTLAAGCIVTWVGVWMFALRG